MSLSTRHFHQAARKDGVIISTCTMSGASGCKAFAKHLQQEYPHLDHIGIKITTDRTTSKETFEITNNPDEAISPKSWQSIFVTGCAISNAQACAQLLTKKYCLSDAPSKYVIIPPQLSSNKNQTKYHAMLAKQHFSVFTSGTDVEKAYCIGLPALTLCETVDSEAPDEKALDEKVLDKNCYGVMYHMNCEFVTEKTLQHYQKYFQQVSCVAKNQHLNEVTIEAFVDKKSSVLLKNLAKEYSIELIHQDRVPRKIFLNKLRLLAERGGIFFTDGAQSHMEALSLGVITHFFLMMECNKSYVSTLLQHLMQENDSNNFLPAAIILLDALSDPEDQQLRNIAAMILKDNTDFYNQSKIVTEKMTALIQRARCKFIENRDAQLFCKKKSLPSPLNQAGLFGSNSSSTANSASASSQTTSTKPSEIIAKHYNPLKGR